MLIKFVRNNTVETYVAKAVTYFTDGFAIKLKDGHRLVFSYADVDRLEVEPC